MTEGFNNALFAREILTNLAAYKNGSDPHGMMDQSVVDKIKALLEAPAITAADVKTLLDEIVHGALATDAVVQILDLAWKSLLKSGAIHVKGASENPQA